MESQPIDADDLTNAHPIRAAAGGRRTCCDTWLAVAIASAALLFVGTAAFRRCSTAAPPGRSRCRGRQSGIARTASAAITTLWTYTPETIDTLADRAGEYLSGDFAVQYRKFIEAAVVPNKQAQITDDTNVVGVSVESFDGANGVVIVFTNTTATSPLTGNMPALKYVAYRVGMQQRGSRWSVTNMATISFIDLTPKL